MQACTQLFKPLCWSIGRLVVCPLGRKRMKLTRRVVGRLLAPLTHLLVPHYSLHLRAPLHSFVRSLTHSLPSSWKRGMCLSNKRVDFIQFLTIVGWLVGNFDFFGVFQAVFAYTFLDASSHLYTRVCPSVGPSVRWSVRPSVRHTFLFSVLWFLASLLLPK